MNTSILSAVMDSNIRAAGNAFTKTGSTSASKTGAKDTTKNPVAQAAQANDISGKNEAKLSERAQEFLKELRAQYGDYDFMIGNHKNELQTLSQSGSKEFSVIFSSSELERMAKDAKYAREKMQSVEGAVKMSRRICEEQGFLSAFGEEDNQNGIVNKLGVIVDDNGNMKFFAELEKTSAKQKERIEKTKEEQAKEQKKADSAKNNPYEKKDSVKRIMLEASTMEELLEKIKNVDWGKVNESHSGDKFNFTV